MIIYSLLLMGMDLIYLSGAVEAERYEFSKALLGAGFLYLTATSLFRVFNQQLGLGAGSVLIGLGWGTILTGYYVVVLQRASADKSTIAVSVTAIFRNTGVSVGVTAAFAVIAAAGFTGEFRSESGYTAALVMAAVGAFGTLLASLTLPGRAAREAQAGTPAVA